MRIASFIFIILFSFAVMAEHDKGKENNPADNKVSGKVTDHLTGENLAGVKIMLLNSDVVSYTDFEGNFVLDVPASHTTGMIQISYISYETTLINVVNIPAPGEIKILPVSRR
jgi:hypothetical protein